MNSEWFNSAFADFVADLEEKVEADPMAIERISARDMKLLKLAYVAGAREALDFSQHVLNDELAG